MERTVKEVLPALETNKEQVMDEEKKNKCSSTSSLNVTSEMY